MQSIYERAKEFGYVNARLRAARPLLLSRETLNTLCEVSTIEGMLEVLMNTAYGPYIDKLSANYIGFILVSKSTMQRFSEKVSQISKMIRNDKRELLYVATGRFDVYNLKLLFLEVMGKIENPEYIECGVFSGKHLELLRNIKDIELLKRVISHDGYHIRENTTEYSEIADDIENSYYTNLRELKKKCNEEIGVRKYISAIIDYKNFDLAIREGRNAKFIEGGAIGKKEIVNALKKGEKGLLKLFDLEKLYDEANGSFSWLEELYDRKILMEIIHESNVNPFSMIGVIGYIRRLDIERRNIRSVAIAKGILTSDEVKKRIIW